MARTAISPRSTKAPETGRRRHSSAEVVRAVIALPHPGPIALVLAATAGFALIAPGEAPAIGDWVALLGAMLGGQLAIGAVNEVVDAADDAIGKPWKPIPAGLVSTSAALALAGVGLIAMAIGSARFGPVSLGLCALGTAAGLAYDIRLKRSLVPWLPYLVALPLIPIWVWTALDAFETGLLALYPLGGLAALAVHLAQALPDVAADRAVGIRSPTTLLGERRALALCWLLALCTPLLALLGAGLVGASLPVVALAAVAAFALVGLDAALAARSPRLAVRACFPCVAIGTAAIGLAWVWALR